MALETYAFLTGITMLAIYLIGYPRSRFFSNILIMVLGVGMMYKLPNEGWLGLIILVLGIGALAYDGLTRNKYKRR